MNTHYQLIARLQSEIDKSLGPIVSGEPFALLDFPDHSNVGDSAIWLGELAFFAKTGHRPSYVCTLRNADLARLDRIVPQGPIFLHGGGNFGDVWPRHQAFREDVLRRFRGRKVVQLPQSIHFSSPENIDCAARTIAEHRNFVLFVRDHSSLDFAMRWFECQVILCPDMAFCLGAQLRPAERQGKTLLLLRTDKEKIDDARTAAIEASSAIVVADWLDEPSTTRRDARLATIANALPSALTGGLRRERLREDFYRRLATKRFVRGLRMLTPFADIISDRLHVHILSTLLGARHCILDNKYGKIGRFVETWSTMWNGVRRSESTGSALSRSS